jgi:DNA-binding response OmpR family regulator
MSKLMSNGSWVVTKESLILSVWGYESNAEDNNVEVYISFLRKKLTHLKSKVAIKTLRMLGYHLEVTEA